MLPSTGLFKSYTCPYYDGTATGQSTRNGIDTGVTAAATTCHRPYCHFKHVRKDDIEKAAFIATSVQPVPEYKATPKLLALPLPGLPLSTAVKKKSKKLEYQPEKPAINASPSSKKRNSLDSVPVYIPAPTAQYLAAADEESQESVKLDLDDCTDELNELSGIIDNDDLTQAETEAKFSNDEEEQAGILKTEIKKEKEDTEYVDGSKVNEELTKSIKKEPTEKDNRKRRDSTGSSQSHSRSKHHKSSSRSKDSSESEKPKKEDEKRKDKEKTTKHRDKEKVKEEKVKEEKKEHRTSSSSSNSKHKSSSSSSSHKSSTRDKDKDSKESKHKSSSSSSTADKKTKSSTSSSSSLSSKNRSSSSSSKTSSSASKPTSTSTSSGDKKSSKELSSSPSSSSSSINKKTEKTNFDDTSDLFATTEEDIMKECEMIYDQLEKDFACMHQSGEDTDKKSKEAADKAKSALKRKALEEEEDLLNAPNKKRVAFENADKHKSYRIPTVVHKPDHRRNAMQAIFNRQEVIKRQQAEDAAAATTALRDAEEKVREANEALRKVQERSLTPLIPKSYLTPPSKPMGRSMIAPVANMLALERAKKKVEELRAEKRPAFTLAQTSKSGPRQAHKVTAKAATSVEPEKQPKPPVLEANSTKISFNIRMQYYELMVKHCLTMYPNVADAWERAQTEELAVLKKCNTPIIYKSSAMLAINKLRKEATDSGNKPSNANKIISHEVVLAGKLANNTSWSVQKKIKSDASTGGEPFDKLPGDKAYEMIYELCLTDEQLVANGFPRPGKKPGTAIMTCTRPNRRPNDTERYCSRCGKVFNLQMYDEVCIDECNYHPKSTGYRRGFVDNHHRCCQQPAGTPGCSYGNYHVTDFVELDNLTGYVTTIDKTEQPDGTEYIPTKKDIYALDCEMCYTTQGIELTRVTVVDINARTVYDALVKPDNKIIDYNTVYSGITEQMLANESRTLRDVQAILMSMFHSKTILIGHSLESDLKALKLIHNVVVDTSVLFPHKMGPPKKRALKTLCIENLKRIIQENEAGHDSAEDAEVCIQLVKFYLRNKIS